jgi:hypothetical protein
MPEIKPYTVKRLIGDLSNFEDNRRVVVVFNNEGLLQPMQIVGIEVYPGSVDRIGKEEFVFIQIKRNGL